MSKRTRELLQLALQQNAAKKREESVASPAPSLSSSLQSALQREGYPWERLSATVTNIPVCTASAKCTDWVESNGMKTATSEAADVPHPGRPRKPLVCYSPSNSTEFSIDSTASNCALTCGKENRGTISRNGKHKLLTITKYTDDAILLEPGKNVTCAVTTTPSRPSTEPAVSLQEPEKEKSMAPQAQVLTLPQREKEKCVVPVAHSHTMRQLKSRPNADTSSKRMVYDLSDHNSDCEGEDERAFGSSSDDDWRPQEKREKHYRNLLEVGESNDSESDSSVISAPCQTPNSSVCSSSPKRTAKELKRQRKFQRNSGKAYISVNGRQVASRRRKTVHTCKWRKCQDVITEDVGQSLFHEYWEQSSYEKRVGYVSSRIECESISRARRRLDGSNRTKKNSYKYFFEIGGMRHRVCKETFLGTLGETDTFLRVCAKKKSTSVSGVTPNDRRGKMKPKHTLTPDVLAEATNHIKSFPAYVSHYCRAQTKQKYLSNTLNLRMMHQLFLAECTKKVSYSTYRRIFKTMKLKFKPPASDTCALCDELKMKIKITKNEEQKREFETTHELHLRKAEAAYNLKRNYKELAKSDASIRVLIFDLEQCLPTPHISSSTVYYLRQLYTYNLTVYDSTTKVTHCYMWHEGEAARGANEIASCLFSHILQEVPLGVKRLYLFSDSCTGQNRNSIFSAMLHTVLQLHCSLKFIDHIFLVRGHTRLECDSKHSIIERSKSKVDQINVPNDWYQLVRTAGQKNSFQVVEMKENFYDFSGLLAADGPLINREKKDNGDKFYWMKTHCFHYSASAPGIVETKSSFSSDPETLNMIRGSGKNRKLPKDWWNVLKVLTPSHPISEQKKSDVMKMLGFIDPIYHEFYNDLRTELQVREEENDPDLPSDSEEL